ncbi:MAG: hypothetical protein KR126chlam2_01089 [Chlamydiae bacterium]|nr:hypothetical protein [Chlamydiota bacterium]
MSTIPLIQRSTHDQLLRGGYSCEKIGTYFHLSDVFDKNKYSRRMPLYERISKICLGITCSLMTVCMAPCCSETFRKITITDPIDGNDVIVEYLFNEEQTNQYLEKIVQQLGFHPQKRDTLITYFEKAENKTGFSEAYGHLYKLFYFPISNFSAFFFIPFKNFKMPTVISAYNSRSGDPLPTAKLLELALQHCAAYRPNLPSTLSFQTRLEPVTDNVHRVVIDAIDARYNK